MKNSILPALVGSLAAASSICFSSVTCVVVEGEAEASPVHTLIASSSKMSMNLPPREQLISERPFPSRADGVGKWVPVDHTDELALFLEGCQ
jgi:hypothetical protein